jgi:hypothetical protein
VEVDTFNVIGFLKNKGYIVGDVLSVPAMSNLLEEIRKASGDDITMASFNRLLKKQNIKNKKRKNAANGRG